MAHHNKAWHIIKHHADTFRNIKTQQHQPRKAISGGEAAHPGTRATFQPQGLDLAISAGFWDFVLLHQTLPRPQQPGRERFVSEGLRAVGFGLGDVCRVSSRTHSPNPVAGLIGRTNGQGLGIDGGAEAAQINLSLSDAQKLLVYPSVLLVLNN